MKKLLVCISLLTVVLLSFGPAAVLALQDDGVESQHILEADGTTGQDTNAGSGVKTGHIQDGAVTDAKITGPISAGKISSIGLDADTLDGQHASAFAPASHGHDASDILSGTIGVDKVATYAGVKVVHKGAADNVDTFNTVTDAIASITDNSATNRYAVLVMPGVYTEDIQAKSYVDIIGQSRTGSIIEGTQDAIADLHTITTAPDMSVKNISVVAYRGSAVHMQGEGSGIYDSNVYAYCIGILFPYGVAVPTGIYVAAVNTTVDNVTLIGDNSVGLNVSILDPLQDVSSIVLRNINFLDFANKALVVQTASQNRLSMSDIYFSLEDYRAVWVGFGHVNIDRMVIEHDSPIAFGLSYNNASVGTTVNVANSRITGIQKNANATLKFVNCYDGNFDPIPNGIYP